VSHPPAPLAALALVLVLIVGQRIAELSIAARNLERLLARGAVEFGREHFAGYVALHALFPVALALEVIAGGARAPAWWPALLLPLGLAESLRAAAIAGLGDRWHVRVWVVPGEPAVRRGVYRWLRHPNYLAVVLELALLPCAFGAWRTAVGATLVNAALLALRLPLEEAALRWAERGTPPPGVARAL
jgi:methyltransferase